MSFIVGYIIGVCSGILLMGIMETASHDDDVNRRG